MNEAEENTRQAPPCSWIGRISLVTVTIIPTVTYSIKALHVITSTYSPQNHKNENKHSKLYRKAPKTPDSKRISGQRQQWWWYYNNDFKLY